jgi:hypothetical protein
MAAACYSIEKDSIGWVIRAGHEAVLICKEKRVAITTARYAGRLMFLHGEIPECDTEPLVSVQDHRAHRTGAVGTTRFRAVAVGATRLRIMQ